MTTTCPFCGAALKAVFPQSLVSVFTCKTVTQEGGGRGLQTIACVEAEVARLTRERDEARERAAEMAFQAADAQLKHEAATRDLDSISKERDEARTEVARLKAGGCAREALGMPAVETPRSDKP